MDELCPAFLDGKGYLHCPHYRRRVPTGWAKANSVAHCQRADAHPHNCWPPFVMSWADARKLEAAQR